MPGLRLGSRAWLIAVVSGASLSLAFPEPDIAPLAWIALAPLLLTSRAQGFRQGAVLWFVFGVAFMGSLLLWISIVGWVAWAGLVLLQAIFIAAFGGLWGVASRWPSAMTRVLLAASLWTALEFVRALVPVGGFTWGELAQSQHNLTWMLRAASLGGAWAVTFLVVILNAAVAEAVTARRELRKAALYIAAAVVVGAAPLLIPPNTAEGARTRLAIVQGNVPRDFGGTTMDKELAIIASHEELTEDLAGRDIDLIVWPESSVGIDAERNPEAAGAIARAARSAGAPMLVGGNLDVGTDRYKVVVFEISPEGAIVDRYQKTHLVPFGEYVPARGLFDWIPMLDQVPRDAIAGTDYKVFDVAGGSVASVISFEGDFGSLVRRSIGGGGRLLVVATNTSTWGESWASAQHVAFSQLRAAENGVWVAHGALSGISAFVDPTGRVVERSSLWTATTLVHDVRFASAPTFYARVGDWLPWSCLVLGLAGVALVLLRRGTVTVKR